ncbi:hypothetical protein HELRODRAFT_175632 [Helobdella robusta]|uniref:Uncharacterized protein n=1 Tax=Helobdella robusta TaxID=6412 RepID=T1F9G1_HELRO|nr:hypothetical protein HELRODRAFT_175632 [Helobdella robusta]ESO00653.1 hypothetical protein HELRODRAFT_175632 [Helobdella robusta]
MLFEERNGSAYSERLANQIQIKLDNAPFKPHNFKLAYDLDAYEAANEKLQKRNTPHNTNPATPSKMQFKILSDSQNSRMFFEAMKLSNLRKQAQKQKQIEINNKNSSSPFQTSGKFYHLNFEPMRIEDYRELDESKINEDLSEIPNKMKLQKIFNDQRAINSNNVNNYNNSNNSNNNSSSNNNYYYNNNDESCKNLDSRNNNDINSVDLCRNANNSYYNNNNCNANTNNNNNINDDNNNMTYNNNNYQKIICSNNCNNNSNNTLSLPKNMTNDDENKNHINNKPNNVNNNNIINNRILHYNSQNNNINPHAKSTPQIQQTNERKNMTKENMAKPPRAGQGRKLPNLPKTQQNNVSRLC